jgi:hypothetical protein
MGESVFYDPTQLPSYGYTVLDTSLTGGQIATSMDYGGASPPMQFDPYQNTAPFDYAGAANTARGVVDSLTGITRSVKNLVNVAKSPLPSTPQPGKYNKIGGFPVGALLVIGVILLVANHGKVV